MNIKRKTLIDCLLCGKQFQTYPYWIKKGFGKYCSKKCSGKDNKGLITKGKRISPNTEFKTGSIPWNYKGDLVGYNALHSWIKRKLFSSNICEFCGYISNNNRKLHWANKSGEYKRDLDDWIRLCVPCHKLYDNKRRRDVTYCNS